MDIAQMYYFVTIVQSNCNLSLAARKIHITQSALSQVITNFENQEDLLLFHRKNGRLDRLTTSGKILYDYAQVILSQYEEMFELMRQDSSKQKGTIRFGVPTGLMQIYFSGFIPTFMEKYPEIKVEIVESASLDIQKKIQNRELDYAILVTPTVLDAEVFHEVILHEDEFKAYINCDHPLAHQNNLTWEDLQDYSLATISKEFISYQAIYAQLKKKKLLSKIQFSSNSWEYLIELTGHSNIVSLLPNLYKGSLKNPNIASKTFFEPLKLSVILVRQKKKKYSHVETLFFDTILNHFSELITPKITAP